MNSFAVTRHPSHRLLARINSKFIEKGDGEHVFDGVGKLREMVIVTEIMFILIQNELFLFHIIINNIFIYFISFRKYVPRKCSY